MENSALELDELRTSIRTRLSDTSDFQALRATGERGGGFDRMLWDELAALGWFALAVPEQYDGLGLTFREEAVLHEELGRYLTRLPVMSTALAAHAIGAAGSDSQKSRWLPAIAGGRVAAAFALPFGRDVRALPTIDDAGVVNGAVRHVLFADSADLVLVPAVDARQEVLLLCIEPGVEGFNATRDAAFDLTRDLGTVELRGMKAPPESRLHLSARQREHLADLAGASLACDAIGGALHILERTVDYMCTRVQFDRPIGSFQALKHRAASWKILQEASSALAQHAVAMVAEGDGEASAAASQAKFYACDTYAAIAGDAVQLHGGIGFTWEHECHLFLKRAKLNQALFGTSTEHKERVAALLLAGEA